VVAAGWATVSGAYQFGVARYNANGTLDATFGNSGKVTTDFGVAGVEDTASGVALQSDGKIVVVGTTDVTGNATYAFAVARYNTDGSLDTSFSADGKTTVSIRGSYDAGHGVAIQPDGKIVVVGFAGGATDGFFGVARLTTVGDLDSSFSGDGVATVDFGELHSNAIGVALQGDGKIVVAGSSGLGSNSDFAVARFDTNGNLDNTFGANLDGQVTTNFGTGDDFGQSVALDSSGNIIVAGQAFGTNGLRTFGLVRYTSSGTPDPNFSGDGLVTTDFFGFESYALGVAVDANNKIIAAGYAQGKRSRTIDFALARYTTAGALDATFDADGKVTTSFASAADVASAVALDPSSGKIVAGGQTQDKNFAVARYRSQ
jgi:uncharacterized delta-60 repeat protein